MIRLLVARVEGTLADEYGGWTLIASKSAWFSLPAEMPIKFLDAILDQKAPVEMRAKRAKLAPYL